MELVSNEILNRTKLVSKNNSFDYRRQLSDLTQIIFESELKTSRFAQQVQIPEDLVDQFVGGHLPVEALNFATELSKSSSNKGGKDKEVGGKVAKALVNLWMRRNCCAEALVRSSIHPLTPAESGNFSRNLFALAENFHLSRQDFPRFISEQINIAVASLARLLQSEPNEQISTAFLSNVLDRLLLRFHTDEETFYPYFHSEDLISLNLDEVEPFLYFVISATDHFKDEFIARRIIGRILLGLGQSPAGKIARLIFLGQAGTGRPCTILMSPAEEFVHRSTTWKRLLSSSIPLKSRVENLTFYSSWADFLVTECPGDLLLNYWTELITLWNQLIINTMLDAKTMTSSTCAVIAFAKALKLHGHGKDPDFKSSFTAQTLSSVFQGAQKCLESTNPLKQACGMSVIQITASLVASLKTEVPTADEAKPPSAEDNQKLKFESEHPFFLKCVSFYEGKESAQIATVGKKDTLKARSFYTDLGELDSDDEEIPESQPVDEDDIDDSGFEAYDMSGDVKMSDALMNLKSLNKRIPHYLSEICEVLMEGQSSKDEAANENLKQIAVMKIPLLMHQKVPIDPSVTKSLTRVLADLEGGNILEIPIICGLYELALRHPTQVFPTMGSVAFDKDHYSAGHRMIVVARYTEVAQLMSKQKCFACFSEKTGKLFKVLKTTHAPFITDYLLPKQAARKCPNCHRIDPGTKPSEPPSGQIGLPGPSVELQLEPDRMLTWREVVERRIAAKTRRFASPKIKLSESIDAYSSQLAPIVWAALANKLGDQAPLLLHPSSPENLSQSLFTAQVFRTLGLIVLGTAGVFCPHLRNIAAQTADLVTLYSSHGDAQVRRAVLSLLGVVISSSEGQGFILELFMGSAGVLDQLAPIFEKDPDPENRHLFSKLMQLMTASTVVQLGRYLADAE